LPAEQTIRRSNDVFCSDDFSSRTSSSTEDVDGTSDKEEDKDEGEDKGKGVYLRTELRLAESQ